MECSTIELINKDSSITNATGRTIYLFVSETKDDNTFTNVDFSNNGAWSVISLEINLIPSILEKKDFGTIEVFGTTQVIYKGRSLIFL